MEKDKLLSIGEVSKLTGVGIKALRYYERIGVLKPVYVEPSSGYRYYLVSQTYLVGIIKFAVELDIPLRQLPQFIRGEDTVDFRAFSAHAKEMVENKMKTLNKALNFFDFLEEQLNLQEQHPIGEIYSREIAEKHFYVMPYEKTFVDLDQYEVGKIFLQVPINYDYDEKDLLEYGILCEYSPQGVKRYIFLEVTHDTIKSNYRPIPAGKYICKQNYTSQIEQSKKVFADYLAGKDTFIAIETEVFSGQFNINSPITELRVI